MEKSVMFLSQHGSVVVVVVVVVAVAPRVPYRWGC